MDKPILNFFRMAALMSGSRVAVASDGAVALEEIVKTGVRNTPDIDALATRDRNGAAVMLWNYDDVDMPGPVAATAVTLSGLPASAKRVLVLHYRIDDTHSNAYTVWKAMGSPQHPTTEQYTQLQARDGLELLRSPEWMDVVNGRVNVRIDLPRQSVSLLKLSW